MNQNTDTDCDIVMIVDKSGSMSSTQSDVIGGFNTFIEEQKREPGRAFVTFTLFDTDVTRRYTRIPIDEVAPLDKTNYVPGGNTALLDAIGATVTALERTQVSKKVIVVIMTDGAENSSHEYNLAALRSTITRKQQEGWAFVFLGAGLEAFAQAGGIGVAAQTSAAYAPTAAGTRAAYSRVSRNISAVRAAPAPAAETASAQDWRPETNEGA